MKHSSKCDAKRDSWFRVQHLRLKRRCAVMGQCGGWQNRAGLQVNQAILFTLPLAVLSTLPVVLVLGEVGVVDVDVSVVLVDVDVGVLDVDVSLVLVDVDVGVVDVDVSVVLVELEVGVVEVEVSVVLLDVDVGVVDVEVSV